MTETGIVPYDLAGNFCEDCGRPKMYRLFDGFGVQDRKTCTDVITAHRCTSRPDIGSLADGQAWECPDCGSTWTPRSAQEDCADCCGDCGHQVTVRRWTHVAGDRMDTAPRYEPPPVYTPMRNMLGSLMPGRRRPPYGPTADVARPSACYTSDSGVAVHVKPGCRC